MQQMIHTRKGPAAVAANRPISQPDAQRGDHPAHNHPADRWVAEQLFEEDVRAVVRMMRPHSRERLLGWNEYRAGGAHFRVTVSWDYEFESADDHTLSVPHMADVMESLLIGSARDQDEILPQQEFGHYREVVRELARRIDEMEACYT